MSEPSSTDGLLRQAADFSAGTIGRTLRRDAAPAVAVASVIGIPFAAYTGLVLHHFYVSGSFLLDAGWTAHLLTHGGPALRYPTALGGESYFNYHVAPLFIAIALFRRALPVSDIQFFAGCIGLCYSAIAAGVFWILYSGFELRRGLRLVAAALVAVSFAFSGLALAIVRYPHSEILIAAAIILFLVALIRRDLFLAGLFLVLALLTREDAGFHVAAILALVIALNRHRRIGWRRQWPELACALLALGYSLAAVVLQRILGDGPSTMTLTYLGDPPFVGLSIERTLLRLYFYIAYRPYIVLPAVIAAIWAIRVRNPYVLVGYAAFVPWTMLQLIAATDVAGTLSGYYAYPFLIASFWPLLGIAIGQRRAAPAANGTPQLAAFAAMIAVSWIGVSHQYNPGRLDLVAAFLAPPSLAEQATTDRVVARLARSSRELGRLLVGTSIIALAPDTFSPGQTLPAHRPAAVDAVAYFVHGFDSRRLREIADSEALRFHYRVPGTQIRIAARHPIPAETPIGSLLESVTMRDEKPD
jgi:hypothetical protein